MKYETKLEAALAVSLIVAGFLAFGLLMTFLELGRAQGELIAINRVGATEREP